MRFQNHPQAWTRVDAILQQSQSVQSKIIALNVLTDCIKTRWKILQPAQREGIKRFIVNIIIQISSEPALLKSLSALLSKLNLTLVQARTQHARAAQATRFEPRARVCGPGARAALRSGEARLVLTRCCAHAGAAAQILKQDWPQNWPNFIPELVNSSQRSESLCANNLSILKLLRCSQSARPRAWRRSLMHRLVRRAVRKSSISHKTR